MPIGQIVGGEHLEWTPVTTLTTYRLDSGRTWRVPAERRNPCSYPTPLDFQDDFGMPLT